MTWTPDDQRDVGQALLGSWPGTIAAWGREGFAAYIAELQARGLTAERMLMAIRTWPAGSDFPPSAPNLAAAARRDPSKPTFDEALELIRRALRAWNRPLTGDYANEAELLRARERMVMERAESVHPLVASFIARRRIEQLQKELAELGDEEWGSVRRRDLQAAWDQHCEAFEGRDVAAMASGRRDGLQRLDPLAALGIRSTAGELERGDDRVTTPPTQEDR